MSTPPHTKILNRVAREVLKPIGAKQKGRSRTWLDDNGWWVTLIEFQPSNWSRGSYLNVGVNWQWYPKDDYSFDMGYRTGSYVEYESDEQFEVAAREFADQAKTKVIEYRQNLRNVSTARETMERMEEEEKDTIWNRYHLGVVNALAGLNEEAISNLRQVMQEKDEWDWVKELYSHTEELISVLQQGQDPRDIITRNILEARRRKKLDEIEINFETTA